MTISAGSRLGPYEVLSPLGAGGMGEVYKARDTRLERTMAIKVLPQHLSASPEVRQRFEREAKTGCGLGQPVEVMTNLDSGTAWSIRSSMNILAIVPGVVADEAPAHLRRQPGAGTEVSVPRC
jgi:serine/threonine protein kinase